MKPLTMKTCVTAVAMAISGTPLMAAELSTLPLNPAEKDTHTVIRAETSIPFYVLHRLDADVLGKQKMTDQELTAVEGEGIATSPGQVPYFRPPIIRK